MMTILITKRKWMISVHRKRSKLPEHILGANVLASAGCLDIDRLDDNGTYQARIPVRWMNDIRGAGLDTEVRWNNRVCVITGEMP